MSDDGNLDKIQIALISSALAADAVIGNVQEKTMKEFKATNCEVVTYSYFLGFIYILVGEFMTGTFTPAFRLRFGNIL